RFCWDGHGEYFKYLVARSGNDTWSSVDRTAINNT
ncbi:unnamed protein product, partial [marine sediment metagenome]